MRPLALAILPLGLLLLPSPPAPGGEGPAPAREGTIAPGEVDPGVWGEYWPFEYQGWRATREARPAGQSRYKRGWDTDRVTYDKLSEFPFLALLYSGWGFGIEYNEPRGHWYMLIDQSEVDPSRTKPGGACLTCKTSYSERLRAEMGDAFLKASYLDALHLVPERHRALGVSCPTCHAPGDASLSLERQPLLDQLAAMGKGSPTQKEMGSLVCAQCHSTYIFLRDPEMKVTGVVFPWRGSRWGEITVEKIIRQIRGDAAHLEWKQAVTGFGLGAIRHPEFELFSRQSIHWVNGVGCSDCHMPELPPAKGGTIVTDHDIKSPLKDALRACAPCHHDGAEGRRAKVLAIQDRTVALLNRAGYATATAAKLFQLANSAIGEGQPVDQVRYDAAREEYLEAFYRVNFIAAENSMGFHNPGEAERILTDALAWAGKAEKSLRALLVRAGAKAPDKVDLDLPRYLNGRGGKKLAYRPEQEFSVNP